MKIILAIKNIRRIYRLTADEIIALQDKLGWYNKDDYKLVLSKWEEAKKILAEAPSPEEFTKMLEDVGFDYSEFIELYGREKIDDAILYGKDLKDRYTVLWLNYLYF